MRLPLIETLLIVFSVSSPFPRPGDSDWPGRVPDLFFLARPPLKNGPKLTFTAAQEKQSRKKREPVSEKV